MLVTASARSVTKESGCYCYSGVFTPCNSPIISPIATKKSELLEILSESLKSKHCIEIRELFLTQFSVCLTLRQVSILPFTDAHFLITCDSISHGFIHRENSDNVLFFFLFACVLIEGFSICESKPSNSYYFFPCNSIILTASSEQQHFCYPNQQPLRKILYLVVKACNVLSTNKYARECFWEDQAVSSL